MCYAVYRPVTGISTLLDFGMSDSFAEEGRIAIGRLFIMIRGIVGVTDSGRQRRVLKYLGLGHRTTRCHCDKLLIVAHELISSGPHKRIHGA